MSKLMLSNYPGVKPVEDVFTTVYRIKSDYCHFCVHHDNEFNHTTTGTALIIELKASVKNSIIDVSNCSTILGHKSINDWIKAGATIIKN